MTNSSNHPAAPAVLTIAGSDPSGGAGIQADLATFHAFATYGMAAMTLLTVQNTLGVTRVDVMDPVLVGEQIDAVVRDIPPRAIKIGALGNHDIVRTVADRLAESLPALGCPLVLDPVVVSKHGHELVDRCCVEEIRTRLIPMATVVTPNAHEAVRLTEITIRTRDDMLRAAEALADMGAKAVCLSGPTNGVPDPFADDLLYHDGHATWLEGELLPMDRTHGTGCVSSASIASGLALGHDLETACRNAKRFVTQAIRTAPRRGQGIGPLNLNINMNG